jgi:hypothetical protein
MKKIIITLLIIHCSLIIANAQVGEQWVKRYNSNANSYDAASYIICTHSGKIVVTGCSTDTLSHGTDVLTIMYDQAGTKLWEAHYNGTGNSTDYGSYITTDLNDNIIIAGSSIYQEPGYGALLIKYNSLGDRQWVVRDDVQGQYRFGTVVKTDDSNNIYLGTKYGTFVSGTGAITKYSPGGSFLWSSQTGRVYDILITKDGSVYAAGTSNFKYFLNKYTRSGTLLRSDTLSFGPGLGNDAPCFMVSDDSSNIYLTESDYVNGNEGAHTLKKSPSGQVLWERTYSYNSASTEDAAAILLDSTGNVYIAGSTDKGTAGLNFDYFVIKYSNSGIFQWAGYYDGSASKNDFLTGIVFDIDRNIVATGYSQHDNSNAGYDFATVKFSSTVTILWEKRYNGPNDSTDYANCIATDNLGNFFVAGGSGNYNSGLDFVTIKYEKTTGIIPISNEIPSEYKLFQNYPNPFNPVTKIKFDVAGHPPYPPSKGEMKVSLKIYDILGKEITTLVNEQLRPGSYEVMFDGSNLPSGVYFYQLRAGDYIETKKLILLK